MARALRRQAQILVLDEVKPPTAPLNSPLGREVLPFDWSYPRARLRPPLCIFTPSITPFLPPVGLEGGGGRLSLTLVNMYQAEELADAWVH